MFLNVTCIQPIIVELSDKRAMTTFVLFDKGVEKLIGQLTINIFEINSKITFKSHFLVLLLKKKFLFFNYKKHFQENVTKQVLSLLKN